MDATSSDRPRADAAPPGTRGGRLRDRRGRGVRGPAVLPGPLSPRGVPLSRSPKAVFDDIVLGVVERIEKRWADQLGLIEFAVEEIPLVPDDWDGDTVPLGTLVRGSGVEPTRLVVFRRPIEQRCDTRPDLAALVLAVVAEELSGLLGRPPEEIDPGYDPGQDTGD